MRRERAAVSKLTCKQCMEMEIKWVMECGAVLCGGCIGKVCLLCNRKASHQDIFIKHFISRL